MRAATPLTLRSPTIFAVLLVLALLIGGCAGPFGTLPRAPANMILFIGDGMGPEQLKVASLYETGQENGLFIQGLSLETSVTTYSASDEITDSAAAATAMATGRKVQNGAISVLLPGDGSDLPTILELMLADGKAVGLVTTTQLTHATPAAFGAHVDTRSDYDGIAWDYLNGARPNVLFGGGGFGLSVDSAIVAGYSVATGLAELQALAGEVRERVAALIGDGHLPYLFDGREPDQPSLLEMTESAISLLSQDPDGFFLMVEAGRIDHAGHINDLARMIPEVLELDDVVEAVVEDAVLMADTLVVVTADHETGGLSVLASNGAGLLPEVSWSTGGHTSVNVPLVAAGRQAHVFTDLSDNTEVFGAMVSVFALAVP